MIGDDQRAGAGLGRKPRVLGVENALDDELAAPGRGSIPRLSSSAAGSNCSLVHCDSTLMPFMPLTWPSRLPKVLRLPLRMRQAQDGLRRDVEQIAEGELRRHRHAVADVRWRWPSTCRSTVSTSALHFAALARSINSRMKPRSRMT